MVQAAVGVQTEIEMIPRVSFLEVEHLHQPEGWLSPGYVRIDTAGMITAVNSEVPADWPASTASRRGGYALPGMANLHSHAFQRAMVGFAEHHNLAARSDSFWTWRRAMYGLAGKIRPQQLQAVAAQAFLEMLEAGMTSVGEFHYLHHDSRGQAYDDVAELSLRILAAAQEVGIAITLLPVLYAHGGFASELAPEQRRFASRSVEDYLQLIDRLRGEIDGNELMRLGMAPHSLRAVREEELREALTGMESLCPGAAVHMHIAEQAGEVEDCVPSLGQRPLAWLFDHFDVCERWCLVHATHGDDNECRALAQSGAVAGLCPSTEANLGDGLFPLVDYLQAGGRIGIGSDSQISIGIAEELRLLEYGQRLFHQRRNLTALPADSVHCHSGRRLFDLCLAGGAQALQQPIGSLRPGQRADMIFLDAEHPRLSGHDTRTILDAYVFAAGDIALRDVMVAGRFLVEDRMHKGREKILDDFRATMRHLGTELG